MSDTEYVPPNRDPVREPPASPPPATDWVAFVDILAEQAGVRLCPYAQCTPATNARQPSRYALLSDEQ
jgi:hypothetical protein